MNEQQRYDMKVGGTIKVSRKIKDYLPLIAFAFLSVLSIVLYHIWFDPDELSHVADAKEMAAVFYFFPLGCICGAAAVLYALESLSVIRIRRNQTISTILLSVIGLFMLWAVLSIAENLRNCELLGGGIQRFVAIIPKEFFPEQFTYIFSKYLYKSMGMLIYELIAIGLFAAIGKRASFYKDDISLNSRSKYVPFLVFALLFVLVLVFYELWYTPPTHSPDNNLVHRVAALAYFYPLCIMFGSATILYVAELFGILRIKRNKVIGYILLGYIILISLWAVLTFAAATYKEVGLFGAEFKHMIKRCPEWLFPRWFGIRHQLISVKFTGVIIYEILGFGVFSTIGRKDT